MESQTDITDILDRTLQRLRTILTLTDNRDPSPDTPLRIKEIVEKMIFDLESTGESIPPDLEVLMEWEAEGGCEATDGCWVEPDGTCPHGCRSWLLELGLI